MKILVEARGDGQGNLLIEPVNPKHVRAYAKHMLEMTGHPTYEAFFQGDHTLEVLADFPQRYLAHLRMGWPVRFKVDSWTFGHWLGYDAHEVRLGPKPKSPDTSGIFDLKTFRGLNGFRSRS